jgi:hypothetical protein
MSLTFCDAAVAAVGASVLSMCIHGQGRLQHGGLLYGAACDMQVLPVTPASFVILSLFGVCWCCCLLPAGPEHLPVWQQVQKYCERLKACFAKWT